MEDALALTHVHPDAVDGAVAIAAAAAWLCKRQAPRTPQVRALTEPSQLVR